MESNICFFVARVFFQIDGTVANVLPRDMCIYLYVNIFTYIHYICIYIHLVPYTTIFLVGSCSWMIPNLPNWKLFFNQTSIKKWLFRVPGNTLLTT